MQHFDHDSDHGTYVELKISIRAIGCLNIMSKALLGCSFVTKQCKSLLFFIINDHLRHEFCYGTHQGIKSSIGASDCLNITSVALLGCSFMARQCPSSLTSVLDP